MKIKKLLLISLLLIMPGCSNTSKKAEETPYKYTIYNQEVTINYLLDEAKSSLEELVIPSYIEGYPVTKIAKSCFEASLIKKISFEEDSSLKEIYPSAFADMINLTSISLPSSLEAIGEYCFTNCSNLEQVNFSEDSKLTYIADCCFYEDVSLKEITLPSSLLTLGKEAFYGCSNLINVTFLGNIKTIKNLAFDGCSSVEILFLGNEFNDENFDEQWNYDNSSKSFLPYKYKE